MSCLQTLNGISNSCQANLGGLKRAWIGNFDNFTVTVDETQHTVTALTGTSSAATLYEYQFNRQTGSISSQLSVDEGNDVRYYTNTANLVFTRMEASKHAEMEALGRGHLLGIFEDANGKFWLMGADNYMSGSEQTAQSGTAFSDLNGYNTTLSQISAHLPYEIAYDTFKALVDGYNG